MKKNIFLLMLSIFLTSCYNLEQKPVAFFIKQALNGGHEAIACEYTYPDFKQNYYCSPNKPTYHIHAPDGILFYDNIVFEIPDEYEQRENGVAEWMDIPKTVAENPQPHTSLDVIFVKKNNTNEKLDSE